MAPMSTAEVAALVGVHRVTLEEWLARGRIRAPRKVRVGSKSYRLWADRDVEAIRAYKGKFYRKGRGRKKKNV